MKGLTMPGAYKACPYWREYRKAFGDEGLRIFATFHFADWLDANHPPLAAEVDPPRIGKAELRRLARAAILAGRKPADMPGLLIAGAIERRWQIPVEPGILTQGYWCRSTA